MYPSVSAPSTEDVQTLHQTSQRDQFSMKLRIEFEYVCFNLLVQSTSPSLDVYLEELPKEEQLHLNHVTLEQQESSSGVLNVAYDAKGNQRR